MANTPVAVLGAGSLGLLLAARLAASGRETTVWTRSDEQASALKAQGIELKDALGNVIVRQPVQALPFEEAPTNQEGLTVLVTLKQTAVDAMLTSRLNAILAKDATLVSFCNGIGHLERLAEAMPDRAQLAAVTTEGALRTGPAEVRHTGRGGIWMGQAPIFKGSSREYAPMPTEDRIKGIENRLEAAGFSISVSNNMTDRILRKLLMNSVINPLTALLRIRNGDLLGTGDRLALMRAVFEETLPILQASGLSGKEDLWEELLEVCSRTSLNESSMLQDVRNGRATEIEAINGAIARLAADRGIEAPWNEKMAALVRAISNE